jgi:hypothetical protein
MGSGGSRIAAPFFTSTLDGGEWSASRPGRFTSGNLIRYPLDWRVGGRSFILRPLYPQGKNFRYPLEPFPGNSTCSIRTTLAELPGRSAVWCCLYKLWFFWGMLYSSCTEEDCIIHIEYMHVFSVTKWCNWLSVCLAFGLLAILLHRCGVLLTRIWIISKHVKLRNLCSWDQEFSPCTSSRPQESNFLDNRSLTVPPCYEYLLLSGFFRWIESGKCEIVTWFTTVPQPVTFD